MTGPTLGEPPATSPRQQPHVDWCEVTLTARCNQRCFFCYEDGRDVARDPGFEEIARLLDRTRGAADQVVLCGKEVLLRPDVLRIVAHAAGLGLKVVVFTNGQALARPGLVEELVAAGCASVAVSFHFPDAVAFARGTRTAAKGFARTLEGLRRVAAHNLAHPARPLGISVEADLSTFSAGRLAQMRATLRSALDPSPWSLRLASLLPTRTHEIGLDHVLPSADATRAELTDFVASHPPELPLGFVKIPLCMLPAGHEQRSLEAAYVCQGTALTFNHGDPEAITGDAITPSVGRDLGAALAGHPYRWLCRTCDLVALCRFDRVDWHHRHFEATREQRPTPRRGPAAAEILARIAPDDRSRSRIAELGRRLPGGPYPEEEVLEALSGGADSGAPRLVEAWVHERPILAVELEWNGRTARLLVGPPPRAGDRRTALGAIVDYLEVRALPGEPPDPGVLRAALRALAARGLPGIARWEGSVFFDARAAERARRAWRSLGELLWPGVGEIAGWRTARCTLGVDESVGVELRRPPAGRVLLTHRLQDDSERLSCSIDARAGRALREEDYRPLIEQLRARVAPLALDVRISREAPSQRPA